MKKKQYSRDFWVQHGKKVWKKKTPEERQEFKEKMGSAMKRYWDQFTPEERSKIWKERKKVQAHNRYLRRREALRIKNLMRNQDE